jgi:hypothetical protein
MVLSWSVPQGYICGVREDECKWYSAIHPSNHILTAVFNIRPQNLLRTLTESQVKSGFPDSDLKLLLTTVKEGRVSRTITFSSVPAEYLN